jgi:phosphoglucomutase
MACISSGNNTINTVVVGFDTNAYAFSISNYLINLLIERAIGQLVQGNGHIRFRTILWQEIVDNECLIIL